MEEKTRKPRTDVKALVCAILDILRKKTDKKHPMTAEKIGRELRRYDLDPDPDTVATTLTSLREHYRGPDKVKSKGTEKSDGKFYTYAHYLERDFSAEEVEMLINDVMFSRMRTQGQAKSLIRKLKELAGPRQKKDLAYADFLPFSLYTANTLVQWNIPLIQRVISWNLHKNDRERVISFRFNGYGTDHEIHEVPGRTGTYKDFLPLKIFEAYGHYYVMGLLDKKGKKDEQDEQDEQDKQDEQAQKDRPWNFRLDLMTMVDARERDKVTNEAREEIAKMASGADALAQYLTQHLYMAYERKGEKVETVQLRVEKICRETEQGEKVYYKPQASMTILHDAFGKNYKTLFENDRYVDVQVEGVLWGIISFVRQNMDRVRLTGPESAKARVEAALRKDFEAYFDQEEKP